MADEAADVRAEAVQSHATAVVAWDVPSAIVAGERFRIRAGARCASECPLANDSVGVYNHEGVRVAAATLTGDLWPGTTALYAAEVDLTAPADEGLFTWSVRAPEGDAAGLHEQGSATFGVRVVRQPDHLVTIEAIDNEKQAPLAGARVVMFPYHAVTDAQGVAQLRVAKGTYRLFVSETGYMNFAASVEIAGDVTTRAELIREPVVERN